MRKKLITRTAKLLSESKKNRRHQGVAVAYEHIPTDVDERMHGSIYAVINVKAQTDLAEEVGETIIETFHGEYYQDLSRDPIASLEAALAKVNEELAEITHQGNTVWLGNLHAVLAVTTNNMIHITRTGKAEAYLYRGGRAKHASEGIEGDNINPLRTFAYTASAELIEGDKLVIATPGVFYHISKNELQKFVLEFQPKVAISHLADLLEDGTGEVLPNSILIIEAITPEAASEETIQELDDEVWIEAPRKPVKEVVDAGAPIIKKVFYYLKVALTSLITFISTKLWPAAKKISGEIVDIVKNIAKKDSGVIEETREAIASEGPKENFEDLTIHETANDFIDEKPSDKKNTIYIKETETRPKLLNIDLSSTPGIKGKLAKLYGKYSRNRRLVLYIAILIVLVLGIGLFSSWRLREGSEKQKLAEASYTEAQNKLTFGEEKISSGDKKEAAETLRAALDIVNGLKNNSKLKDQATELSNKIQAALDIAEGVIRPGVTTFATANEIVGGETLGPFRVGNNLYLISKETGSISGISIESGEVSRVLDKPSLEGKITSATAVPVRSVLVIFTNAGKIYEFDTKDVELIQQTTAGDFEESISLASFSTNIYSLGADGKIYKRLRNSSGYGARTEYITDGSNVSGAVSLAIDSNVYALKSNGEITKYLGGKIEDFQVSEVPFVISQANNLYGNEDTVGLYALESSAARIIRIDTSGNFVSQYASENFRDAAGIYMDEENKTLFVVSKGIIYKISI